MKNMKTKRKGLFIILSSPSGAGKTTLARKLIKNNKNIIHINFSKILLNDKNFDHKNIWHVDNMHLNSNFHGKLFIKKILEKNF